MTAYTPGPYRAVIRANQHGVRMAAVDTSATGGLVWEPSAKRRNGMLPDHAKDDAILFAAAPDLLEALQAIIALRDRPHGFPDNDWYEGAFNKARDAIVQATGPDS